MHKIYIFNVLTGNRVGQSRPATKAKLINSIQAWGIYTKINRIRWIGGCYEIMLIPVSWPVPKIDDRELL